MNIDWTDFASKISQHFTVKEALWLPQWNRLANESDGLDDAVKANLIELCNKLDIVRNYFGASMNIHCMYRPDVYNALVHGAPMSAHKIGRAADFDVSGMSCGDAIQQILDNNMLEVWNLRCENNGPQPTWIHLGNDYQVGHNYYFKP